MKFSFKKLILVISILALFTIIILSSGYNQTTWNNEVKYSGALSNAMIDGDISAKMQLSELEGKQNLYALGAVGNLKGEIQIFDSELFITFVKEEKVVFDKTLDKSASLIVYTEVKEWKEIKIPNEIETREQFEEYLKSTAKKHGLDIEKPFPFLLSGTFKENDWHIIDWDENDKEHTHQKHRESGLYGTMKNTNFDMLGFFSLHHVGIFTHHTTNMHIHFKTKDNSSAGHSDDFVLENNMVLKLPIE
jgi:acetolactate decarboxylase